LNQKKNQNSCPQLQYTTSEHKQYIITNPARVYDYTVPTSSFDELENAYKRDLFGNYKKKEHVDKMLKEYLEKNSIVQKRVVINTEGWVADINVQTNVNPATLVFELENNSLFEAGLDGAKGIFTKKS